MLSDHVQKHRMQHPSLQRERVVNELFLLSQSQDVARSAHIIGNITHLAGFGGGIVVSSHLGRRGYIWRIIAASDSLTPMSRAARIMPTALSDAFPGSECTAIDERLAVGRRDKDVAGATLCAELAARGFRTLTPVYVSGLRKRGQLGVLALSVEDQATQRDRLPEQLPVLRLAVAALAANCAQQTEMEPFRLSKSERMVLELLAAGLSPAEIAESRGTSIRTVRNQLESAKRRLDASTGVHAVALAMEMGAILYQDVHDYK